MRPVKKSLPKVPNKDIRQILTFAQHIRKRSLALVNLKRLVPNPAVPAIELLKEKA